MGSEEVQWISFLCFFCLDFSEVAQCIIGKFPAMAMGYIYTMGYIHADSSIMYDWFKLCHFWILYLTSPKKEFHHFTSLFFMCFLVFNGVGGGRSRCPGYVTGSARALWGGKLQTGGSAAHSGTVTTQSLQAAEPAHCSCCTVPRICLLKL